MTGSGIGLGSMHADIHVTPMIDVLLVLLIIFMMIVPSLSRGEVAPAPRPAHGTAQPDAVVLEILKGQPVFRINQQPVSRQELPARLATIFANRSERVLFVKGDDGLSFTEIAQAIDRGHAVGIDRVGIITPGAQSGR